MIMSLSNCFSSTNAYAACIALTLTCSAYADDDKKKPDLPLEGKTETLSFTTDQGSWLSIDVMADGESIVFDLLGDLYTLPMVGGEAIRITSGLGFDSQPTVSPDGQWLAFISDRSGADNVWISKSDGSEARKLSDEKQVGLISPAWTADSQFVVVTKTAVKPEMAMYHRNGGAGVKLSGASEEDDIFGVGVVASPDGRYLYYAKGTDSNGPVRNFPATQIIRYQRSTGVIDQLTRAEGGAVRPALSPDGNLLVYGTRENNETGLRLRNLTTGADRWLTYPIQRDSQENYRPPSRDLLPGYSFTPDGAAIVLNAEGKIWRVEIDSDSKTEISFSAEVDLAIGPDLTAPYRVPQGDLTATIIHDPALSADQKRIAASVLSKIYVMENESGATPERLTSGDAWEFKPVWSPDNRWISYVTWSMNDGGHIWRTRSNGNGRPQQLTDIPAFYTDITYGPDGDTLFAMRGNEYMRHQTFSEFTGLGIPLELITLPASGGEQTVIKPAEGARSPHFGPDPERIYLYDDKGLFSIQLDGSDRQESLVVTGPRGNRRGEKPPQAEAARISPDGKHALAWVNKQIWAIATTEIGGKAPAVDVRKPALPVAALTDIGADFFGWTRDGESVWWAIGNTFYSRPLASLEFRQEDDKKDEQAAAEETEEEQPFVPKDEHETVQAINFDVIVARDTPSGSLLLTGANVITMSGSSLSDMENVLENHDVLITDNRIAALGKNGTLEVPVDATVINIDGKYVVPGFIDTHAHWEFRTQDVLEPQNWTLIANLAYGVTAGLDVQTTYKDYLTYRDFVETGQSIGQRAFMTAQGIFGNNDFKSYDATLSYLRRYKEHYHTNNIKSYVVGNRQQRQWVVLASKELGLMPTTEGAGDQKLDITHAIDGMHSNEHTMPDSPIFDDVVQLYARTKTAYTPTLVVQYNAESLREFFFTRSEVQDDPKMQRFYPRNRLNELTERRPGWVRDEAFQFKQAAAQVAKIQRAGGLVGVGAHGELQGLGYHWEMWGFAMGGMRPVEVLRAATIDGAKIIGINQDLGSIEVGKLADMVVLNANPLDDILNTVEIDRVVKNGRLYDGDTLDEEWPNVKPLAPSWWWSNDDARYSTDAVTN
jgi:Tol biopolymer transport system component/predicted amidohydrolase